MSMRGLYAITDSTSNNVDELIRCVDEALTGGASIIQYREKRLTNTNREQVALQLHELCRERGVPLIINDDVRLAQRINADGVHLGHKDTGLDEARQMLGPAKIIGISCYGDIQRAKQAEKDGASYVAFGRFFASTSKPQATLAPIEILTQAKKELGLPIVAIGGITAENGQVLIEAGADMLAVINGVFGQEDVTGATQKIAALF